MHRVYISLSAEPTQTFFRGLGRLVFQFDAALNVMHIFKSRHQIVARPVELYCFRYANLNSAPRNWATRLCGQSLLSSLFCFGPTTHYEST